MIIMIMIVMTAIITESFGKISFSWEFYKAIPNFGIAFFYFPITSNLSNQKGIVFNLFLDDLNERNEIIRAFKVCTDLIIPFYGQRLWFTVLISIVATVSGVFASVFSASRLLGMLAKLKQVLIIGSRFNHTSLIVNVVLAITLTILFDLTRIAAMGAIFYLAMDIAVHWGLFRYLRKEIDFNPIIPLVALVFDIVILSAFLIIKFRSDPLVPIVSFIGIIIIVIAERLFMKTHTDDTGTMHMEMEDH